MWKRLQISADATTVLKYLVHRDGCGPDIFDFQHVAELIRCGCVERVVIGCDEPTLHVTPGGFSVCRQHLAAA